MHRNFFFVDWWWFIEKKELNLRSLQVHNAVVDVVWEIAITVASVKTVFPDFFLGRFKIVWGRKKYFKSNNSNNEMWQMQIYQDRKDFHEWNLTNLKFYLVILVEQATV